MANDLKRVGLIFTEDGAKDFKKTLQEVNLELNKNYNQFRVTQAQWDSSTKSTEKLRAQQEYLKNAYEIQQDKVKVLSMQLADLENAENKNTTAIKKKRNELVNAELKLKDYESKLKDVNSSLNDNSKKIQDYGKKISDVSEKISDVGNKASVISAGVAAGGTILANNAMNLENAVAKYVSSTNIAENETGKYKQVLENINNNNYGEGYEDIADAMSHVTMQMQDLNEQDLQNITEKAIALRDLFGYDVSESVRAVKAMMDNLNVSADEAFNLIAEGKKQGLDFSNELLDNINEYSVQFGKLGLSAEDMFNIFKIGSENGAFNLDKIGDAVKEFSIRAIDGSNTTIDGFKRIGLNADEMAKKFANGGEEAKEAFVEVVNRLGNMDDKVSQSIAGVDLFGTMWEDLGPTVITSFSKMDNGISKSSDSMQKSIDQLYNTTKKKAEAQLKRLQSLGADFGEEMLPVLEDLIDMAEGFVDKLNDMSDAEKENIVKIGLFVSALGPVIKTAGTAGQVIGGVTQGIGTFTQAIGVATGKTTSSVASVNNLANVFTKITSPIGLATLAITATAGALTYLAVKQAEAQQETKEFAEEMANSKTQLEEYNENIDKTMNANLSEIDSIKDLREELKTLVDENGNVKEGYETRVSFILNELNKALGTEYELNGNVIQSYKDLQDEIDETIEKKRAEIILQSKEEKYTKAIQEEADAVENLKKAHDELGMSLEDAQDKYDELVKKKEEYERTGNVANSDYLNTGKEIQNLENLINAYKDAESTVKTYTENRKDYEESYALFVEGKYDEISNTVKTTTQDWTNSSLETIRSSITEQGKELDKYKQIYEDTGSEVAKTQMEQAEQNLSNLANELIKRTSTIGILGAGEISAWKTLGNSSFEEYKTALSQMDPTLQAEIQSLTGIVANDATMTDATKYKAEQMTSVFEDKLRLSGYTDEEIEDITNALQNDITVKKGAEELAGDLDTGFNSKLDGWTWGWDLVKNIHNGLTSKNSRNLIATGASIVGGIIDSILGFSLPEEGPLSDFDKSMPDMIDLMVKGIKDNRHKALNETEDLAQEMNNRLSNIEGKNIETSWSTKGNRNNNSYQQENSIIDYDKMANAMLKALTNCKFTLDEDGFAKIVKDELYKVV